MDIDREQYHDHYAINEIQKKYHLVFSFEVIEHLAFEDGIEMLSKMYDLLLWSCNHPTRFPRSPRFVLGARLARNLYDLLETLIRAVVPCRLLAVRPNKNRPGRSGRSQYSNALSGYA